MSVNVSDFLIRRLNEWGLHRIYGFPGDGINGIIGAIGRAGDKVDYVQVRHEEMSAFMACAHAKFTGEVGVCLATSGPGAVHLLNGLYDAKMDHQSVVAIVGQQARMAMGGSYQQEVDLLSLFKDVAGDYVHMATVPSQMRHLVDRAVRIAKAERTVTCIIVPNDLQEVEYEESPRIHGTVFSGVGLCTPRIIPTDVDLRRAADILNVGKKIAILVGVGALGATDEVAKLQKQLGGWARSGIARVKMKIGLDAKADREGVAGAREAIGPEADLFVDANGAYSRKQALAQAEAFAELNVTWFEEPVTSDDLEGLRLLRDRAPAGIDITAGEYGYDLTYFERLLSAGAVDVLQADATRCCGITDFLQAAANAPRITFHCPRTARLRCTCIPAARSGRCGTPNTFTITSASKTCSSRERLSRATARSRPTFRERATG